MELQSGKGAHGMAPARDEADEPRAAGNSAKRADRPLERFESAVNALADVVFGVPFWLFCLAVAAFVVMKNGIGIYPMQSLAIELKIAAEFPELPKLVSPSHYLLSSLTGPILARILGIKSIAGFIALHILAIIVGVAGAVAAIRRREGDERARLLVMALACSSLPMVLLGWIGCYDAFTVLGILVVTIAESPVAVVMGAMLLGFSNFEQGVFVVAIMIILKSRPMGSGVRGVFLLVSGLVLGKALALSCLDSIALGQGRLDYVTVMGLRTFVKCFVRQLPILIGSWFGAFWVWLAVAALSQKNQSSETVRWSAAVAVSALASLLVLDETRVFALVSVPLVLHVGLDPNDRVPRDTRRAAAVMALCVATILPSVFVWEGSVHAVGWTKLPRLIRAAIGLSKRDAVSEKRVLRVAHDPRASCVGEAYAPSPFVRGGTTNPSTVNRCPSSAGSRSRGISLAFRR